MIAAIRQLSEAIGKVTSFCITLQTIYMIIHHVFFWLHEPDNAAHVGQLTKGLQTLASIPQVKQLLIGKPASTEKRPVVDNSYQVSELMYFDSLEDQAAYQEHPIHQAFVQQCSHLWSKVLVYDMAIDQ